MSGIKTVEAVQLVDDPAVSDPGWEAVAEWCGGDLCNREIADSGEYETRLVLVGGPSAGEGDWIIKTESGFVVARDVIEDSAWERTAEALVTADRAKCRCGAGMPANEHGRMVHPEPWCAFMVSGSEIPRVTDTEPDTAERAALGAALTGPVTERERIAREIEDEAGTHLFTIRRAMRWAAWVARGKPAGTDPGHDWLQERQKMAAERTTPCCPAETAAVVRAVRAERERIAQVAEDLGAHYHGPDYDRSASFADYLKGAKA